MKLELPVRWAETDEEQSKTDELIHGDKATEKIKYSYGKLLIDANDIGPYYDIDENHTIINDALGKTYVITIPIDQFKKIMTEITGHAIMAIQVRTEYKDQTTKKKNSKDSNDNILL